MADTTGEPVEIDGMLCYPKDEVPEEPPAKEVPFPNCANDPRFQQVQITRWCYQMYIDYHRCTFLLGAKPACNYFYSCYSALCPNRWVERWDDQVAEGTFPRDLKRKYYFR